MLAGKWIYTRESPGGVGWRRKNLKGFKLRTDFYHNGSDADVWSDIYDSSNEART